MAQEPQAMQALEHAEVERGRADPASRQGEAEEPVCRRRTRCVGRVRRSVPSQPPATLADRLELGGEDMVFEAEVWRRRHERHVCRGPTWKSTQATIIDIVDRCWSRAATAPNQQVLPGAAL